MAWISFFGCLVADKKWSHKFELDGRIGFQEGKKFSILSLLSEFTAMLEAIVKSTELSS